MWHCWTRTSCGLNDLAGITLISYSVSLLNTYEGNRFSRDHSISIKNTTPCQILLFLCDVLLYGSQTDQAVAALQQPAGCQVPLVLILQTGVLRAQVGHLLLQLPYPSPLPLQQLLLGLDDLVKLLQIFHSPGRVLGRAFHVAPSASVFFVFFCLRRVVSGRRFSVESRLASSATILQWVAPFMPRHCFKPGAGGG